MTSPLPSADSFLKIYEQGIIADITKELDEYIADIPFQKEFFTALDQKKPMKDYSHEDRLFEYTTHPSQTGDTLIKQKIKEAKIYAFHNYDRIDLQNYTATQSQLIFDECRKRIYSLENAKIPAHATMTSALLAKVPNFFTVYKRYTTLPQWKSEEKAEEKNISFSAFLEEEKQEPVYLDERWEAVETAKKMLLSGEEAFYQWIDFDGAKRPDGIMLSIFAELLIDDINQGGRGISEQDFVKKNSLFTLSEREENRKIVQNFHATDRSIYALTRHLASNAEHANNPVCIAQMEQLKKERERYLRKLLQIKDESKRRKSETTEKDIIYISEKIHFIPRFDPKFIAAVQKSELGNMIETLSAEEMQHYKTASHIIDQVITLNSLSPNTVHQIILAQCTSSEEIITLEKFIKQKVKWWKEKKAQYEGVDPMEDVSLCPLLETKCSTSKENINAMLQELLAFYKTPAMVQKRIPEFFFAGSDLSKSMGSASSFVQTWHCAIDIWHWNRKNGADIKIKLGSGESLFRQSGFLDPKFKTPLFSSNLSSHQELLLQSTFGVHWENILQHPGNGLISLIKKYPWLNSITLQSKAREWVISMPYSKTTSLLQSIHNIKNHNKNILKNNIPDHYSPSEEIKTFTLEENKWYEHIIGSEKDTQKNIISLASLIELFATEITPVLRDRSLKRDKDSGGNSAEKIKQKISNAPQINARAISANTASLVLYPLVLLGKAEGFHAVQEKYGCEGAKKTLSFLEAEDLLQVIRQFSLIAPEIFHILRTNGFESVAVCLEKNWNMTQLMVPSLIEIICKTLVPQIIELENNMQEKVIECLEPRLRSLLSGKIKEGKVEWSYTAEFLEAMQKNWQHHAATIIKKACQFLSQDTAALPFSTIDQQIWDTFLTIQCRLQRDTGLLG